MTSTHSCVRRIQRKKLLASVSPDGGRICPRAGATRLRDVARPVINGDLKYREPRSMPAHKARPDRVSPAGSGSRLFIQQSAARAARRQPEFEAYATGENSIRRKADPRTPVTCTCMSCLICTVMASQKVCLQNCIARLRTIAGRQSNFFSIQQLQGLGRVSCEMRESTRR